MNEETLPLYSDPSIGTIPAMADKSFSVLVFDMARTGKPDGERRVDGFQSFESARAYAEARVRASVEELRSKSQTAAELRSLWHIYGEDCSVLGGGFSGRDNLDRYIAMPASPEECDWVALAPPLPGRLRPRRFHVTLMVPAAGLSGLDKWVWAGGFLECAEKPTRTELLEIYREDAMAAFARKGFPDVVLEDVSVVHLYELPDPPLPSEDGRPLSNWKVVVDFVCHDIKFGSTAQGVFQWPETPTGDALDRMRNVLIADKLALRGDGPDWVDLCEVGWTEITPTGEPPTHP